MSRIVRDWSVVNGQCGVYDYLVAIMLRKGSIKCKLQLYGLIVTSLICMCCFLEKDWEDIKRMPEHSTLMKDFKKNKYVS